MIKSFGNKLAQALFDGNSTKETRRFQKELHRQAIRKLTLIDDMRDLDDLKCFPGNNLEALKRDRIGQHSIRINDQWRICFVWDGTDALNVEITDYH